MATRPLRLIGLAWAPSQDCGQPALGAVLPHALESTLPRLPGASLLNAHLQCTGAGECLEHELDVGAHGTCRCARPAHFPGILQPLRSPVQGVVARAPVLHR